MPMHGMRIAGQGPGGGMPQMPAASEPAMMPDMAEMSEMPVAEDVMPIPEAQEPSTSGRVSQEAARYMGPEYRCAGCVHFWDATDGRGECEIVQGPIDPEGVCSLFEPDADSMGVAGEPEAVPEAPIDEEAEV